MDSMNTFVQILRAAGPSLEFRKLCLFKIAKYSFRLPCEEVSGGTYCFLGFEGLVQGTPTRLEKLKGFSL